MSEGRVELTKKMVLDVKKIILHPFIGNISTGMPKNYNTDNQLLITNVSPKK